MHKITLLTTLFVSLIALPAMAGISSNLPARLEDKTPREMPVKLKVQKVRWNKRRGEVRVWGEVENRSRSDNYEYVTVSFTCYGFGGKFLGRHKTYVDPYHVPAGKKAVIDGCFLDSDGKAPDKIQFIVSGTSK